MGVGKIVTISNKFTNKCHKVLVPISDIDCNSFAGVITIPVFGESSPFQRWGGDGRRRGGVDGRLKFVALDFSTD